jgi:malonyl-CoA/methylmalonyl-CoA synthetase
VLKTGGYKVSALDIEREILSLPEIAEAIVVGIDDMEFGQRVAAAVVLKDVSAVFSTVVPCSQANA